MDDRKRSAASGVYRVPVETREGGEPGRYRIRLKGRQFPLLGDPGLLLSACSPHLSPQDWVIDADRRRWRDALPTEREFWLCPSQRLETAASMSQRMSIKDWNPMEGAPQSRWLPANPHEAYEVMTEARHRSRFADEMGLGVAIIPGATMVVDRVLCVLVIDHRRTVHPSFSLEPADSVWPEGTRFLFTKAERR